MEGYSTALRLVCSPHTRVIETRERIMSIRKPGVRHLVYALSGALSAFLIVAEGDPACS